MVVKNKERMQNNLTAQHLYNITYVDASPAMNAAMNGENPFTYVEGDANGLKFLSRSDMIVRITEQSFNGGPLRLYVGNFEVTISPAAATGGRKPKMTKRKKICRRQKKSARKPKRLSKKC
jgi:hypothetical protein